MAKKPWGGAGAWAAESELAESQLEQEGQQHNHQQQAALFTNDTAFPSLGEAATTKTSKKKTKQTLSLGKFIAGGPPAFSETKGLTTGEKMALPTGPRDRSGEEPPMGGLGGGFRDYGGGFRGEGKGREYGTDYGRDGDSGFGSRRSAGDREGRGGGFLGDRDDEPSRADSTDDWGAGKKLAPPSRGKYDDDGRRGSRFDDRDFSSRADDDSDWGSSKKYVPAPASNAGSRRVSKYDFSSSRAGSSLDGGPDGERWGTAKKSVGYDSFGHKERDFWTRDKDGGDVNAWTRNRDVERVSERPRLVLQPRSQPSESSPPRSSKENAENQPPHSEVSTEVSAKPQKVNPFGEAKPREVVLEEKGLNWKKLDAELEQKSADSGEAEEASLKEEIKALQEAIHTVEIGTSEDDSNDDTLATLKEKLSLKEQELELLSRAFVDKVGGLRGTENERGWNSGRDSDAWSNNGRPGLDKKGGRW